MCGGAGASTHNSEFKQLALQRSVTHLFKEVGKAHGGCFLVGGVRQVRLARCLCLCLEVLLPNRSSQHDVNMLQVLAGVQHLLKPDNGYFEGKYPC